MPTRPGWSCTTPPPRLPVSRWGCPVLHSFLSGDCCFHALSMLSSAIRPVLRPSARTITPALTSAHPPARPPALLPPLLQGFKLVSSQNASAYQTWPFPPGVVVGPQQYLVVYLDGKNYSGSPSTLHTGFLLNKEDDYLGLLSSSGAVTSDVTFPRWVGGGQGAGRGCSRQCQGWHLSQVSECCWRGPSVPGDEEVGRHACVRCWAGSACWPGEGTPHGLSRAM